MAPQMHHRYDLDHPISSPVHDPIRKSMDKVTANPASFVAKWPEGGRLADRFDGSVHLAEEFRAKILRTFFVPRARVFQLCIHIRVYINFEHCCSGEADL
jgi:hypothetical protein